LDATLQRFIVIGCYTYRTSSFYRVESIYVKKKGPWFDGMSPKVGWKWLFCRAFFFITKKNMTREKKTMGVGAVVSALSRLLHPSAVIREKYVNPQKGHRVENLLVIRRESRKINSRDQMAIIMRHDDFPGVELYCVERYAHINTAGPAEHYFEAMAPPARGPDEEPLPANVELPQEVVPFLEMRDVNPTDAQLIASVVPTDDDNEPAPENVPEGDHFTTISGEWGHSNICNRKVTGVRDTKASIHIPREVKVTLLRLFELFFFKDFVIDILLPLINNNIAPGETVSYGEFLRFIGLWLLMATTQGATRRDYWSVEQPSRFKGAPFRFGDLMSRNRFEAILYSIRYTNVVSPPFRDPFHEVRQMIQAWNANMESVFTPSWITCLDESMSYWTNIYSCPGFMFVPRKPWPFGNEYHTICCASSGVMFAIELVEGKDRPREMGAPEFDNLGGKTVGLLLRLTKLLWNTGKVVVLDSGFCVARALTHLADKGVFATALIKKRRYWPKYVNGDMIKEHLSNSEVGDTKCYRLTLPEDNAKLDIHCLKEPDYTMMLMATFGTIERVGPEKIRIWKNGNTDCRTTFRYPELFHNHYHYRHAVDDHNNRRHSPISIERTWSTHWWPHRVFAFLIAITEVNTIKCWVEIVGNEDIGTLGFRRALSEELINNSYLMEESAEDARRERRAARGIGHTLISLPPFRRFHGSRIVPSTTRYPQRSCSVCKRKCRDYCSCSPGTMLCNRCFPNHLVETEMQMQASY
jgi:hypothetical protein